MANVTVYVATSPGGGIEIAPAHTGPAVQPYESPPTTSFQFNTIGPHQRFLTTDDQFSTLVPTYDTAGFSVSYWVKSTDQVAQSALVGAGVSWDTSVDGGWAVEFQATTAYTRFFVEDWGANAINDGEVWAAASWQHFVAVFDPLMAADAFHIYKNGVHQTPPVPGITPGAFTAITTPMFIGKGYDILLSNNQGIKGAGTEIALWDGPLSAAEAQVVYNHGTPPDLATRTNFDTDLIAWYNGVGYDDSIPGNPVPDQSGNSNDAVDASTSNHVQLTADVP
jgi:hypothetical protein